MRFLLLALTLLSSPSFSHNLSEGWAYVAIQNDGTRYAYHAASLIKDEFPPNSVSAKIAGYDKDGKLIGLQQWEYKCKQSELRVDAGQPVNIASESSVRKDVVLGLCGVERTNGYWFLVGTIPDLKNPGSGAYYLIDAKSLKKVSHPVSGGVYIRYDFAVFNRGKPDVWDANGTPMDLVMDCNDTENFYYKDDANKSNYQKGSMGPNTVTRAINHLFCNGYYPINKSENNPVGFAKDLSNSKRQCLDLGFRPGTESFGKCVLNLSK